MAKKLKRKGVKDNGGAREGSGRKPVYGEKLTKTIALRLNEEQSTAAYDYCMEHHFEAMTLVREASLEMAGLKGLGLGKDKIAREHLTKVGIKREERTLLPVKFTPDMERGIIKYAKSKKIHKGTFLKEALMQTIGRPELGLAAVAKKATENAERMSSASRG